MDIQNALRSLSNGYCLWIGAGVTRYMGEGTEIIIPLWSDLVNVLEESYNIKRSEIDLTNQERLQKIFSSSNYYKFRKEIRKHILNTTARAIIKQAEFHKELIPTCITNISRLGLKADPIINFNFETFSSYALSIGGGPYEIRTYGTKETMQGVSRYGNGSFQKNTLNRFKRNIYHPNGAIDIKGLPVLTLDDYRKQRESLAYQLAAHCAFDNNLMIVGMSLEDKHLQEHLNSFRSEIRNIFWFKTYSSSLSNELKKWIWMCNINIIEFDDWSDFWNAVSTTLPEPDLKDQIFGWMSLISQAIRIINETFHSEELLKLANYTRSNNNKDDLIELKLNLIERGLSYSQNLNSERVISEEQQKEILNHIENRFFEIIR